MPSIRETGAEPWILRDLLIPLQEVFSTTTQGQKRKLWFLYTLLVVIVPFTSSMKKLIEAKCGNAQRKGAVVAFESKVVQAATMLEELFEHYPINRR